MRMRETASEQLRMRLTPTQRNMLEEVADAIGKNMTDVIIELISQAYLHLNISKASNRKPNVSLVTSFDQALHMDSPAQKLLDMASLGYISYEVVAKFVMTNHQ